MYGLLAEAGRGEDNAALGGQVAHISAAEAGLLEQLGGAGTTNPATGLLEYYTSGVGGPGSTGATGGPGGVAASGPGPGSGIGVSSGGPFGFTASLGPSSPGTTGTGSAVGPTPPMGFMVGDGGNVSSIASADGGPQGFSLSGFLSAFLGDTLGLVLSPFGKFANQYGLFSSLAQSVFGDSAVTNAVQGLEGFSNRGEAVPTVNVPPNSLSLSAQTSPYGPFGDSTPTSLVTPQAEAAEAPTSLNTPIPFSPLSPTSLTPTSI
jgi:hypothetical protein